MASIRAEMSVSQIESETLYTTSINQIEKQLEIIDLLVPAKDDAGMEKEMPAILHACLNINAFYYTRLIRNFFDAYNKNDNKRMSTIFSKLTEIIKEAKEPYADIFGNR